MTSKSFKSQSSRLIAGYPALKEMNVSHSGDGLEKLTRMEQMRRLFPRVLLLKQYYYR